jgi:hypothetical protein
MGKTNSMECARRNRGSAFGRSISNQLVNKRAEERSKYTERKRSDQPCETLNKNTKILHKLALIAVAVAGVSFATPKAQAFWPFSHVRVVVGYPGYYANYYGPGYAYGYPGYYYGPTYYGNYYGGYYGPNYYGTGVSVGFGGHGYYRGGYGNYGGGRYYGGGSFRGGSGRGGFSGRGSGHR